MDMLMISTTEGTKKLTEVSFFDPAMSYFRNQLPENYRRRWSVSRLCSEWEEVVPPRSDDRTSIVPYTDIDTRGQ